MASEEQKRYSKTSRQPFRIKVAQFDFIVMVAISKKIDVL